MARVESISGLSITTDLNGCLLELPDGEKNTEVTSRGLNQDDIKRWRRPLLERRPWEIIRLITPNQIDDPVLPWVNVLKLLGQYSADRESEIDRSYAETQRWLTPENDEQKRTEEQRFLNRYGISRIERQGLFDLQAEHRQIEVRAATSIYGSNAQALCQKLKEGEILPYLTDDPFTIAMRHSRNPNHPGVVCKLEMHGLALMLAKLKGHDYTAVEDESYTARCLSELLGIRVHMPVTRMQAQITELRFPLLFTPLIVTWGRGVKLYPDQRVYSSGLEAINQSLTRAEQSHPGSSFGLLL